MVNLKQKDSVSEEDMNVTLSSEVEGHKKSCADCHTTTTPLWRGGPAGPRTLCNACGIRQRKKRRAAFLGIDNAAQEKNKKKRSSSNTNKVGPPLKIRFMTLGRKMVLQRSTWHENQMNQLGEEEQAAVLLMALSCGSFYS